MKSEFTKDEQIAWKHAALILSKKISVGSAKANSDLSILLKESGGIEQLYDHFFGFIPVDESVALKLDDEYEKITLQFTAITINDERYPEKLRSIEGAPPILYCKGDLSLLDLKKTIAFVGTRNLVETRHLAQGEAAVKRLIDAGFEAIVSGLALGADTLGHRCAIENGGRTIGVLGNPLNVSYPKENKLLQDEIGDKHLLVSEYPIGIRTFGSFFANRNRTTVGLSTDGVVVARAGDRSGTQYAIRHCIEQGKQLYVLENNVEELSCEWVYKYKKNIKVVRV